MGTQGPPYHPLASAGDLENAFAAAEEGLRSFKQSEALTVFDCHSAINADLPENGFGAVEPIERLVALGRSAKSGGQATVPFNSGTPAAVAASWLSGHLRLTDEAEQQLVRSCLAWVLDLFGLPASSDAWLTRNLTNAHMQALVRARDRVGARASVLASGLISEQARSAARAVFSNGYIHDFQEGVPFDPQALIEALGKLSRPGVVMLAAGEPRAGCFDLVPELVDAIGAHSDWVHIDAFHGLFGRLTGRFASALSGIGGADSVVSFAGWLNTPYAVTFLSLRNKERSVPAPTTLLSDAIPVWASLRAYGRNGYREMVERHLDLAQQLAAALRAANDFELLFNSRFNIVCFRRRPTRASEMSLDAHNEQLASRLRAEGFSALDAVTWQGKTVMRATFADWRLDDEYPAAVVAAVRRAASRLETH